VSAVGYHKNPQRCLKKRKPKRSKIDDHVDSINAIVEAYPSVSAVLVLDKLKAKGFDGQISIGSTQVRHWARYITSMRVIFVQHSFLKR
jgi:hypothetical protein